MFRSGPSYGSIQGRQPKQATYRSNFSYHWELHEPDGSNGRSRLTSASNSHTPKEVTFARRFTDDLTARRRQFDLGST